MKKIKYMRFSKQKFTRKKTEHKKSEDRNFKIGKVIVLKKWKVKSKSERRNTDKKSNRK